MPTVRRHYIEVCRQRTMPWRNGGGTTREVAIEPATSTVAEAFRWRLSCATVGADGPFSRFPGVDRSLWLLRGRGIELSIDGDPHRLETPLARVDFPGESAVHGRLLGGPIDDCNIMVRRGLARAVAAIVTARGATGHRHEVATPGTTIVLALLGPTRVDADDLAEGDALRLDHDTALTLVIAGGSVLVATFVSTSR